MAETNSEFTPQEKERINELLALFREHAGSTSEQLHALGVTDEDMELFARVVALTTKAWENFTGAFTGANGRLFQAFEDAQTKVAALGLRLGEGDMGDELIPAGTMMAWDKEQGCAVPMPKQESSQPRKACANLDCEFNAVTLEPGLFRFAVDRIGGGGRREINCIAFRLGSEKVWLCEDCAKKLETDGVKIRLS
ncbi:MAG: hypothetical protein AB9900_12600 [Humidesulfovibrio sp.]